MNSTSQPGDRLREKLRLARESTPQPSRRALEPEAAGAEALVDRHAALPDPMALARMYQASELRARLVDDEVEVPAAPRPRPPEALAEAPAAAEKEVPEEPQGPTQPLMSPAEIRAVMAELQDMFSVSERSYETFELSSQSMDDVPMISAAERRAEREASAVAYYEEATGGTWLYVVGGVLTIAVILGFIYLALYGPAPFRAKPAASPSPPASAAPSP
ncbi:MAG: hypothetical protein QOE92_1091 [Chloroflexota bacterium]|nr:hypothetical protein [Chloroflexota bacterium]